MTAPKIPKRVIALLRLARDVGTEEINHDMMGSCPEWDDPVPRDPKCPACRVLVRIDKFLEKYDA